MIYSILFFTHAYKEGGMSAVLCLLLAIGELYLELSVVAYLTNALFRATIGV